MISLPITAIFVALELAAFMLRGLELEPDTVVFLNGLNDIHISGPDGLEMDYREYLGNFEIARRVAQDAGIEFVVAPQPFPHGKSNESRYKKSALEQVTIVSDQWHFADRGQQLLAECLARELDALPNLSSYQSTSNHG